MFNTLNLLLAQTGTPLPIGSFDWQTIGIYGGVISVLLAAVKTLYSQNQKLQETLVITEKSFREVVMLIRDNYEKQMQERDTQLDRIVMSSNDVMQKTLLYLQLVFADRVDDYKRLQAEQAAKP